MPESFLKEKSLISNSNILVHLYVAYVQYKRITLDISRFKTTQNEDVLIANHDKLC